MPQITVAQITFERLQRHAKPLIVTPDSVVSRALNALEGHSSSESDHRPADPKHEFNSEAIDPNQLPDLKHAKVLEASIGDELVKPANWNSLLRELLVRAMKRFGDFGHVQQLCSINMVQGIKDDEGYKYLAEIEISFQGVPANAAANAAVTLAPALGVKLHVAFQWRRKEQAHRPGQRARLQLPSSSVGGLASVS